MGEGSKTNVQALGVLALSLISTVSIVICNKILISNLGFVFVTTLSSWHLVITYCSFHAARWLGLFQHKPIDKLTVIFFGFLNATSIAFLNLSLQRNSVGFYQMMKLATIPCTILLETIFLKKKYSADVQVSLLLLLIGIGIATVSDLQVNAIGTILAINAILTTCVAQIMTNNIQRKFKVSSAQLLYQSCAYQAGLLLLLGPLLDHFLTQKSLFSFDYNSKIVMFILLSCSISVSVNFSSFFIIGKTSVVTYQVVGHLKTCLILISGYAFLNSPFSWRTMSGISIALLGMVLYSYITTQEMKQKSSAVSEKLEDRKDEENGKNEHDRQR